MTGFDTFVMVDWSAGNDRGPRPVKDAIWAGVVRLGQADAPVFLRNRQVAESWISDLLTAETSAGRRTLVGFDFPFSYPVGFGPALTGTDDPFALWQWFEDHVTDTPKANNRFDLAGQINQQLGKGKGPFWFNGLARDIPGLPKTKAGYHNPFPERRRCETQAKGTFTCWQMGGAGAVGGQVFMGLPVVNRLKKQHKVAVWPSDDPVGPVVFAEIWPSLTVSGCPEGWIKDAWQVTELASQFSRFSLSEWQSLLNVDKSVDGWILGLPFEAQIRGAA